MSETREVHLVPVGVKTNGIGQKTTAHLNLTRTLADVWRATFASAEPSHPSHYGPAPSDTPERREKRR